MLSNNINYNPKSKIIILYYIINNIYLNLNNNNSNQ